MPITTSPWSRYFSYHAFTNGSARRQLMQEYVQKSTTTTLPRRPSAVSGAELSHSVAPSSGGSVPCTGRAPAAPRADVIAPPVIAPPAMAPLPRIIAPPDIAPLPDIIAGLLPDMAPPDIAPPAIAGPGNSTFGSVWLRSGTSFVNSNSSSFVVLAVDTRARNPVSSPNAIAIAPTTTAPPSTRR